LNTEGLRDGAMIHSALKDSPNIATHLLPGQREEEKKDDPVHLAE
jgi:hypothetical protein